MDIEDLKNTIRPTCDARCFRCDKIAPQRKKILGFEPIPAASEEDIIKEARRCIYCYNSPCSKCCPIKLDVKEFVHAAASENWYYASKVILSSNPMPLSTGNLCCVRNYCQGGCNLKNTLNGAIKTNAIQLHAVRTFKKYKIKPMVPVSIGKKVAIVGAGPSGLSCASFLRRFGIDVTIYEKEEYAGGLLMSELTPNRLPLEDIQYEIQLVKDMGVEFKFKQTLGKDFTIDSLIKNEGFSAVFLAFGRPDDIKIKFPCEGTISSHEFLREICGVLKLKNGKALPDYKNKKVLVLGAGETAIDCASAASRLGGNVTMAFRKDFKGMRSYPADVEELLAQEIEFLPLVEPSEIKNGEVKFRLQERTEDGKYKELDEYITRKYDVIITAFGATLDESKTLVPGEMKIQKVEGFENVFVGGDLASSNSVAEAVNDAKTAAKMIAEFLGIKEDIPLFMTEVDNVSLETTFDGNKFKNPFGLAAAPTSGTYECIRNAFKAGFGWTVTKTINLDKDLQKDNDFRITRCGTDPGPSNSFFNLCLQTELPCQYWLDTIKKLKAEFPDRVIIASICCQDNKEDWQWLVKKCLEVGADGFELALSCPNGAHNDTGTNLDDSQAGVSIGRVPSAIKRITEYVVEVAEGKPVYPKLTPNITDILAIARGALNGKASGISGINTVAGIPKFYPDGTPFPQVGQQKYIMSGGISGDMIRPMALRHISKIHNSFPSLNILGIGGIWNAYCALQMIYAGANVIEVCSAIQRYSYEIVHEMISGLQFYLYAWSRPDILAVLADTKERKNLPHKDIPVETFKDKIPTLSEIRGLGAKYVVERDKVDNKWAICAKINVDTCIGCGSCALSCRDNSVEAISQDVNGVWKIDETKCLGCALCQSVCPVNAIDLIRVPDKDWHHPK